MEDKQFPYVIKPTMGINDVHGNGFAKGDEAKSEPEDCILISH